eukprot:6173739-Pleurochrysis_carterae.AAC.5
MLQKHTLAFAPHGVRCAAHAVQRLGALHVSRCNWSRADDLAVGLDRLAGNDSVPARQHDVEVPPRRHGLKDPLVESQRERDCLASLMVKSALPSSTFVIPRPRQEPVASRYKTGIAGRSGLKLLRIADEKRSLTDNNVALASYQIELAFPRPLCRELGPHHELPLVFGIDPHLDGVEVVCLCVVDTAQ